MLIQLTIGSAAICAAIVLHAVFIVLAQKHLRNRAIDGGGKTFQSGVIVTGVLWMLLAQTVTVWLWAIILILVGAFEALEPAVYFSLVAFTTLGFGDVLLAEDWRLLGGLIATNGMIAFGLTTGFILELLERLRRGR